MFRRFFAIAVGLLLFLSPALAQEVKVNGHFLPDSIKIGELVPYSLTAKYPSSLNLVFPDSTYSFAPFEIQKKKYFTTQTANNISYDSVVYFLTTFEIDSLQTLSLPVFAIHARDCTTYYAARDTLFLQQLVKAMPDSVSAQELPLKVNTAYQNVKWLLNYWVIIIATMSFVIAAIVIWVGFGKRIKKYFILRRLQKRYDAFVAEFSKSSEQLKTNLSVKHAENVIVVWKRYMESLLSKPYTTATSKEILLQEKDEPLGVALQKIDRMIYKGPDAYSEEAIASLNRYATQRFMNKVEEVKYG